jgi:hypothetical protein
MDLKRRYIFNGSAVAFGGRLVRPTDVVLASDGASALSVAGGRTVWSAKGLTFGKAVRIASASTFAEGLFDDLKQAIEASHGRVAEDTLTSTTSVNAEVKGLSVGDLTAKPQPEPEFRVTRLKVSLMSKSPLASYEAAVRLGDDTVIEGVSVGKHKLIVELERSIFQEYDTRAKLLTAADDPKFVKSYGRHFNLVADVGGKPTPVRGALTRESGYILGTIVKSIRWSGAPYPGSEIDHNTVRIPNFGAIHFGETLIKASARRITMVRVQHGSPTGGASVYGDVDANGSWSS